jgi:membrane-associated phospholipid phosphatase
MKPVDYFSTLVMSVILIVGVYQFYFWCQRNYVSRPRELMSRFDERIPYRPGWVWIYSGLYYPVIIYINFLMETPRQFIHVVMSFLCLLAFQMVFFVFFPVALPERWRAHNKQRDAAERFLAYVQRLDARSNCFPSMHTSVATLTACHLFPHVGPWAATFPALIAVSCLFTKQHYIVDLPAGAMLGGVVYWVYHLVY